jgi:hypothetical protein
MLFIQDGIIIFLYNNLLFALKLLKFSIYWNCCHIEIILTAIYLNPPRIVATNYLYLLLALKNLLNVVLKNYFVKPSVNTTPALITDDEFLYIAFQF